MLLSLLAVLALAGPAAWWWYNRPLRVLARLERKHRVILIPGMENDVAGRISLLSLRLDAQFVVLCCNAHALAGKVLKSPAALQKELQQLGLRSGLPAAEQLRRILLESLQHPAGAAGRTEQYLQLEVEAYRIGLQMHRLKLLRGQLAPPISTLVSRSTRSR